MKKFIFQLFIFILLFLILERTTYYFIYTAPDLELDKRLEQVILGEMNKEVIILGSSRAARNILAEDIQNKTGFETFNLAYPGSDIFFHEFLLNSLLKFNSKPKAILLAMDEPRELLQSDTLRFRYDRLYPLVKYDYINEELISRGQKSEFSKWIISSRINRSNFSFKKVIFKPQDSIFNNGTMSLSFQDEGVKFNYNSSAKPYAKHMETESKIQAFKKIQDSCIQNNIELILIFCPNFREPNKDFENRILSLKKKGVKTFHYNVDNPIYRNSDYYFDLEHLNKKGAEILTSELALFMSKIQL